MSFWKNIQQSGVAHTGICNLAVRAYAPWKPQINLDDNGMSEYWTSLIIKQSPTPKMLSLNSIYT